MLGVALGLLGVFLFLSLVERPARDRCPSCGKPRVVNRNRCEHCGAEFTPPAADGTEIFEPTPTTAAVSVGGFR
jgi:predicted amidophosphoribosyltransferase